MAGILKVKPGTKAGYWQSSLHTTSRQLVTPLHTLVLRTGKQRSAKAFILATGGLVCQAPAAAAGRSRPVPGAVRAPT